MTTASAEDSAVDDAAVRDVVAEYGEWATSLPPIAIVIAAFNEQDVIGRVVDSLPISIRGLDTAVVVVSDGSKDDTARVARAKGALVCDVPVNRGQGAALRLGYRLAREGGATYIVTTDADGQYDPAEVAQVLAPVIAGEADFVTGSRVLGGEETKDPARRIGVRVFALLISLLTGQRITDPAFGLRAMRADVTGAVSLEQPQYQSSELLIAVLARGFRVKEVPATIHKRQVGQSKKGHNAFYGLSFAKVVAGTWWRERRLRGRPGAGADMRLDAVGPMPSAPASRVAAAAVRPAEGFRLKRGGHRKPRPVVGKRFRRFALAAGAALAASQITLTLCLGPFGWTAGTSALAAWVAGAAMSYAMSRWAWERKGKPHPLREVLPFWIVAMGTAAVLTATTKYANHQAVSMGLSHGRRVLFADAAYFAANCVTFGTRFFIFHYLLFADRKSKTPASARREVLPAPARNALLSNGRARPDLARPRSGIEILGLSTTAVNGSPRTVASGRPPWELPVEDRSAEIHAGRRVRENMWSDSGDG